MVVDIEMMIIGKSSKWDAMSCIIISLGVVMVNFNSRLLLSLNEV